MEEKEIEQVYTEIMQNSGITWNFTEVFGKWEKTGDIYKKFSLYDTSSYKTCTKTNLTELDLVSSHS